MPGQLVRALVGVCIVLFAVTATAQEVLTNESVIAMKKAGLSDAVILAKIRSSQSKFDTKTQSLVGLKSAGLSDQIIEAMVSASGPGGAATSAPGATTTPTVGAVRAIQGRDGVFHVRGDQYIELAAAVASVETNVAFFQSKSEIVLKRRKAEYRVVDRQPVFLSTWAPNEVPLVRLKPGDSHDDRNLKFSSGAFMPFGGTVSQGVRTQDIVEVDFEKDPRGFFRIKPREPLGQGEYGFIVTQGFAGGAGGGKIYDFGVD